jgi:hypothetical protein
MKPAWVPVVLVLAVVAAVAVVRFSRRPAPSPAPPDKTPVHGPVVPETPPPPPVPPYVAANLETREGYLLDWAVADRLPAHAADASDFAGPGTEGLAWSPLAAGAGDWHVDLAAAFGPDAGRAATLRTRVRLPTGEDVLLEMGSDGPIAAWLNGGRILVRHARRAIAPRQDFAYARLRGGENELLFRVAGAEAGWRFCCRIRRLDGTPLEDLEVEAR